MRIIKEKTLFDYCRQSKYKNADESIRAWIYETIHSEWENSAALKLKYRNASIITSKRVVFNIKGNTYRLITDIEYKLQIVFIVWFGTHKEYDRIDANTIHYED